MKNLLLIAITFAFANVFTFAADDVEIAQADITRMLGNSHQTAPFDFNYSVDDNGAIHYSFKGNNPTKTHNTYRIYANGKQIHEGVGAIEGAFTPEPNSGDIKLTVSQQVDSKWEYINVNITVPEHAVAYSPIGFSAKCSPCGYSPAWRIDSLIIRIGSTNTFYGCPIKYKYKHRVCEKSNEIEIEGISYEMDMNNRICKNLMDFMASECRLGRPAADGEYEYAKWILGSPCFWFKLYELTADTLWKRYYDGMIASYGGDRTKANDLLNCNRQLKRNVEIAYYSGGCSAQVGYEYNVNGVDKFEVKMLNCSGGDGINCCKRSRTYCIPVGSGSNYVSKPSITIKHEASSTDIICAPTPNFDPTRDLPPNTSWYFVGDCLTICE